MKRIMIRYKIAPVICSLMVVLLIQSCNINTNPTAPNWDVSLNVPITKKDYTMMDILEKNSSIIQHYTDGANKNLLYYSTVKDFDKIAFESKLKIDPFTKSVSQSIGTININSDSVQANIGYAWINPALAGGMQAKIPTINNAQASYYFSLAGQFKSIKVTSGLVDLKLTNFFPSPVSITLQNLVIKNETTDEIVVQYPSAVTIQPQQTTILKALPIAVGIPIKSQLILECSISTNGSNNQTITLPTYSLAVNARVYNLKVSEATAIIPQQNPVIINGTVIIDEGDVQPNKFQNIKFANGVLNLTIVNNLDIDAITAFTIDNLKTPQGQTFTDTRTIPRKQTVKLFSNMQLNNYSIVSPNNSPTNQITYRVNFQPIASNDYRTIRSTDAVTGSVDFSSLMISEFNGQLQPTVVDQSRSAVALDFKDVQRKLKFQQINFKNPNIELRLQPTANLEFNIDGRIEARNSLGQRSIMTLSSRTMNKTLISPTDTAITLNADSISNFFKKFSQFPDSLIIYAGGVVNPNYKTVSVRKSDQVTGRGKIELPLQLGITGGEFSDSVDVDLKQDDRKKIRDLNTMEAGLKIVNGVAASLTFTGKLYDQNKNFLMYFPPQHQNQDTVITILGATTDQNGNVASFNEQTIKVVTIQGEAEKLSRASFMRIKMKFNTSATGNQPVKFKTDDVIKIYASGSANYHVKP